MANWQKWIAAILLVFLAASTTFVAGFGIGHYAFPGSEAAVAATAEEYQEQFQVFWEAWRAVDEQFYTEEPLDPKSMTYGAIRGMVASLGDRHTVFLEPEQAALFKEDLEGEFSGIGATVSMTDEGDLHGFPSRTGWSQDRRHHP